MILNGTCELLCSIVDHPYPKHELNIVFYKYTLLIVVMFNICRETQLSSDSQSASKINWEGWLSIQLERLLSYPELQMGLS